ncbi:MAG TPA: pyruvate, water dikinase regulatory protein [Bauldia sp.]|nr:pyruvate, water dikinase regulatory protein [Bauldia sp.]
MKNRESFFHLHMISDSTGETLLTVARAASAQYQQIHSIEHVHALVRTAKQLDRVIADLEMSPGIVLYTLMDRALGERLEAACKAIGLPCVSVLEPVLQMLQSYLGAPGARRVGAQHTLDAEYFRRIDALNFTLIHDDGQLAQSLEEADVVLVGVSRTSKTPTSIYLANRGVKTANVPVVPGIALPAQLESARKPLIVGLTASPERIVALRENRMLGLNAAAHGEAYVDKAAVANEIAFTRKLCQKNAWPIIDVTRRSIEETAAAIMALHQEKKARAEESA